MIIQGKLIFSHFNGVMLSRSLFLKLLLDKMGIGHEMMPNQQHDGDERRYGNEDRKQHLLQG